MPPVTKGWGRDGGRPADAAVGRCIVHRGKRFVPAQKEAGPDGKSGPFREQNPLLDAAPQTCALGCTRITAFLHRNREERVPGITRPTSHQNWGQTPPPKRLWHGALQVFPSVRGSIWYSQRRSFANAIVSRGNSNGRKGTGIEARPGSSDLRRTLGVG